MEGKIMKKNLWYKIFIAVCMVICLIPFVCMTFAKTDTTTENKELAKLPALVEKGRFNTGFLPGLGDYFNDHFAFRPELVTTDAEIQSKVFRVSNVGTVVVGSDGWLYYTDDLDDYLGKTLDKRAIDYAAHNVALTQQYVTEKGAKFLVTIPPNKSTLYGDQMPYYDQKKISETHNYELLTPALEKAGIVYADLFRLFDDQKETLYLKRDSHWDNQGALLVYDAMLDALGKEHDDFAITLAERTKTEVGDLASMLYPLGEDPEWNVYYDLEEDINYVTDTESVEDPWIETTNNEREGTLLMYRDSFGNTLIPYMADAFKSAYFSEMTPYNLALDMDQNHPDYVIIEKVERNIAEFASDPPIIPAPEVEIASEVSTGKTQAALQAEEAQANMDYWLFSGVLDGEAADCDQVYLIMDNGQEQKAYEAFLTANEDEYGFIAYLPKEMLAGGKVNVTIVTDHHDKLTSVCEQTVDLSETIEP